jgi:hypothetical protein
VRPLDELISSEKALLEGLTQFTALYGEVCYSTPEIFKRLLRCVGFVGAEIEELEEANAMMEGRILYAPAPTGADSLARHGAQLAFLEEQARQVRRLLEIDRLPSETRAALLAEAQRRAVAAALKKQGRPN